VVAVQVGFTKDLWTTTLFLDQLASYANLASFARCAAFGSVGLEAGLSCGESIKSARTKTQRPPNKKGPPFRKRPLNSNSGQTLIHPAPRPTSRKIPNTQPCTLSEFARQLASASCRFWSRLADAHFAARIGPPPSASMFFFFSR